MKDQRSVTLSSLCRGNLGERLDNMMWRDFSTSNVQDNLDFALLAALKNRIKVESKSRKKHYLDIDA